MGCSVATNGGAHSYEGFPSLTADTTGGSDAFCAALAIALCERRNLDESIRRANAAGAMAVTQLGGSPSMPTTFALEKFIRDVKRKNMGTRK
jgi:ribokinase